MNKIKLVKEYVYIDILDIEFNVLIYFDEENEELLYSLKYEDNNYNSSEYLVEYAKSFNEENVDKIIKAFMLDYLASTLNCYIEENEYSGLKVVAIKNGLKLMNDKTQQCEEWNIYDFDEDYEELQYEVKQFIDSSN